MAVEFPIPYELFLIVPGAIGLMVLVVRLGPSMVEALRQRAYDARAGAEAARWILRVDVQAARDPEAARRLIAGLHPGVRRGVSGWAVGWPQLVLDVLWDGRAAAWEIRAPAQLARVVESAVAAAYPDAGLERIHAHELDQPSAWLALAGSAPEPARRRAATPITAPLVEILARLPADALARWRIRLRPQPDNTIRDAATPGLLAAVAASALNQPAPRGALPAPAASEAAGPFFAASVTLEAWLAPDDGRAWLFDAMSLVGLLTSSGWRIRAAQRTQPRPILLGAGEVAELWTPPAAEDARRAVDVMHSRTLAAPSRMLVGERAIGIQGGQRVCLPADLFLRHAAFIGSTGSGKSTQLVAMAAEDLATGRGFTFLDPHGDAVRRLLDAVPAKRVAAVHLIELAERDVPRAFNFLELDGADPELVAAQFVDTLYDLYARYSGPKQTHYLRMALLTLLARPPVAGGPWTVVDLYRLLVNREVRRGFTAELSDEVLRDFWRHEWPLDRPHAREQSVEAVLNKLGGFIAYPTIRDIVGARHSTIRPRAVMDGGEVLLVDLSRVGRDHARLFGSMLIGRYYIDALARQGTAAAARRPHQLYVDEVHNFDTSSLRGILTEARKFGVGLVVATQYVRRLPPELSDALRSNVATLGLLQPAPEDVDEMAALFAPLTKHDLLNMPRFRLALRTEVDGERMILTPDLLPEPPRLGSAAAVRLHSDQRDGRWRG